MARKRQSPQRHSSSSEFEEKIHLLVPSTSNPHHNESHGHGHPGGRHTKSISLAASVKHSFHRSVSSTSSNDGRVKWFALCLSLVLIVAVIVTKGANSIGTNKKNKVGNLRANEGTNNSDNNNQLLQALYELPLPTTIEELDDINEELQNLNPNYILKWAHHHLITTREESKLPHQHPLVQVTSFGPTGLVILHLLSEMKMLNDVPVVTMDTLHLFPESYDFYETIKEYYHASNNEENAIKLTITKPLHTAYNDEGDKKVDGTIESRTSFESLYSKELWKKDPMKFARLTKIDPLKHALSGWQSEMWITGRRRSSGGERSNMHVLEFEYNINEEEDESSNDGGGDKAFTIKNGRWKLNPLAYWSYKQVWDYIREHKLPYNQLYDDGYTSLGDEMTTGKGLTASSEKQQPGEAEDSFERSGRFVGLGNRTECGLHSHLQKVKKMKEGALKDGEELTAPSLECIHCQDLTADKFEHDVATGEKGSEMLIEFYSPYCGSCVAFAPILSSIAKQLSKDAPHIQVARFDITEHEVPQIFGDYQFDVEATPTLYRVQYDPTFHNELYKGNHDYDSIVSWLGVAPEK